LLPSRWLEVFIVLFGIQRLMTLVRVWEEV
jgi:hypothetical protein